MAPRRWTSQVMKGSILFFLVTVALESFCLAKVTKLPPDCQKILHDVSRFRGISSATNLPTAVFALCSDDNGRLAEAGQRWEATDLITDRTLPRKRLIWAVTNGDYYVVHYERGGDAHSFHVLVAKLKIGEGKLSFVWRGVGEKLKDFKAFINAVSGNKLDDTRDYAY